MKNRVEADRPRALVLAVLVVIIALAPGAGIAAAAGAVASRQQGPTPSPTPGGQINLPTATATAIGGPTATPSRTPTLTPVLAEMVGSPTNLRSGPGLDFDIVAELDAGTRLPLIGRWLGYDWLLVQWQDAPEGKAWVYAPLVVVIGDITTVPAVEPPTLPTIDPTQASLDATATVFLQTPGGPETATAQALFLPTGVYTATPDSPAGSGGLQPTFTPPAPYVQPETVVAPRPVARRGGIPPAALIIALGAMGVLTLIVGVLRRL